MNRLTLAASSVADDLAFIALADVSRVLLGAGRLLESRIIGGHMVMLHVQRWGLGRRLYRETQDADLGIAPLAVKDDLIINALVDLGYERDAGNRYVRPITDIPVRLTDRSEPDTVAAIDILTPAYTSRPRENVRISDALTTTEVPGLALALKRPGVELELTLSRLNGEEMHVKTVVPDEVSALVLKALAWRRRAADKDAVDIWRTLEVVLAAGLEPADFHDSWATADQVLMEDFADPNGVAMDAIARAGSLSRDASRARHTRIRALINRFTDSGTPKLRPPLDGTPERLLDSTCHQMRSER